MYIEASVFLRLQHRFDNRTKNRKGRWRNPLRLQQLSLERNNQKTRHLNRVVPKMISNILASLGSTMYRIAPYYVGVEAVFYLTFHKYMVPKANEFVPPAPYRDYGDDRLKLLKRLLRRIEATCEKNNKDVAVSVHRFLSEWFHVSRNHGHQASNPFQHTNLLGLLSSPLASPDSSDDENDSCPTTQSTPLSRSKSSISSICSGSTSTDSEATGDVGTPQVCLYKEDIDKFFSWAFFGKMHTDLLTWETEMLRQIYQVFEVERGIHFPKKPTCPKKQISEVSHFTEPRCMSLEPVNAVHRPLLVYMFVAFMQVFGGLVLRTAGYHRFVASNGLVGWHRPATMQEGCTASLPPLLFFHGIAPAGLILYLPIILLGLATELERPIFLFENQSISCTFDFSPLSEEETVDGVMEILDECHGLDQAVSLVGHSFGSCSVSWLLAFARKQAQTAECRERRLKIQQVVLLDPVAILLSEPDVMVNFLYAQELDKIRMVASSELFTEYYLRRHFAWYNSELWLEDIDESTCSILVCLSENDEILNARKIQEELERYSATTQRKPKTVYWSGVGHGACIYSPAKWKEVKQLMLQQELERIQNQQAHEHL